MEYLEPNRLDDETGALVILDQTLLPGKVEYCSLRTMEEIWQAIRSLQVRGAPAIGIAAGYGAYLGAKQLAEEADYASFYVKWKAICTYLATSRPTAVNLFWALERMDRCAQANAHLTVKDVVAALKDLA